MALPLAIVGIAASAIGGITSAVGAEKSAQASSQAYAYQANIAQLNSSLAKQNEEFAIQTGEQQATQTGLQLGQQEAQIKTSQASAGFDVNSGSNAQVQASQKGIANVDLTTIRSNAAKTAYGYQVAAQTATEQGQLYTSASQNAAEAGPIAAASSFLGGVSSVSNEWLNASKVGLFNSTQSATTALGG